MNKVIVSIALLTALLLTSCVSSVSTKTVKKEGLANTSKGTEILKKAWVTQGLNNLEKHKTYEVIMNDTWQGFLGKASSPWPEPVVDLNIKFGLNSFDGQVTFESGEKKGETVGLQSWKYYEIEDSEKAVFKEEEGKKIKFILPAIQYFIELPHRLLSAQLITYAGEKEFSGKKYDLILATWEKLKAHKQNDQYLLWINKETKLVEYCEFTIHENFSSRFFSGSIAYKDFKDVDNVKIPFSMYLFAGSPKADLSKNLHKITIESFKFDSFQESTLYPNKDLKKMGDSK